MRAFISQPMKDISNEEIEAERNRAISELKRIYGDDIEIIESFFKDTLKGAPPNSHLPLYYLSKSFELLSTADVAYFCNGWEKARGCKMEYNAAKEYGISVIDGREVLTNGHGVVTMIWPKKNSK